MECTSKSEFLGFASSVLVFSPDALFNVSRCILSDTIFTSATKAQVLLTIYHFKLNFISFINTFNNGLSSISRLENYTSYNLFIKETTTYLVIIIQSQQAWI